MAARPLRDQSSGDSDDDEGHSNDDLRMMGLPGDDEEDLVADQEALFGRSAASPINLAADDGDGDGAGAVVGDEAGPTAGAGAEPDTVISGAKRKRPCTFDVWNDFDKVYKIMDIGGIRLSDLIKSYASNIRAIPCPLISPDDLIAGVDRVDNNIAKCIKLAEDTFQRPDDSASPTRNRPEAPRHLPVATSDIFSGIHRVNHQRLLMLCLK
ncbi:zinc finger BED domain-containing protein RICESLEEPER 2-like [Panicum miliaceum]|uniref:Zinc finger BED domain-containing protein RICESLEEPER 2-like n=1 Tax=Panicum miliaceum TaxID=4540 RepID=A0A3L6PKR8_PANMI|nr:zinc finger BED domain-containing protein RICESLEEPER 2-like [Panicum miliaceum]